MSSFNEDLNRWVVDQVKDMSFMFANCTMFNKPLDGWILQSVVNMNHMFLNCTALDQDFSSWGDDFGSTFSETGIVVNIDNIFQGCDAMARRPGIERLAGNTWVPEEEVDPNQIHRAMARIDSNKLFSFFGKYLSKEVMLKKIDTIDFATYIETAIKIMLKKFKIDDRMKFGEMLEDLMDLRLHDVEYDSTFSSDLFKSVYYALEYAKIQPESFQKAYVKSFISECFTAYDNEGGETNMDNLSCAQGSLERLISCLTEACSAIIMEQDANATNPPYEENKIKEYQTLGSIISPPNIDNYASVWFRTIGKNIPAADRRQSFVDFLEKSLLPPDEDTKHKIEEYANDIEKKGLGFTDDYFDGGRGRRRKRSRRKTKKKTTTKKGISRPRTKKKRNVRKLK
jgi:hypothetical protein